MIVRTRSWLLAGVIALTLLATVAGSAFADSGARTYTYLIASGFLCGLDPSACPVISRASENDDTITMSGAGTFSIHPGSVSGGGTFTHKDAGGTVIATGTWTATELLSFHSYGTSPGFPPTVEGGQVLMRVHLSPSGGGGFDAILQVHCLIGTFPPGAQEGIRLAIAGGLNFNHEVSGFTIYIRLP